MQYVITPGIGTLVTLMDRSVQPEFESMPFGIMEYYADTGAGDLLLLMSDLQVYIRDESLLSGVLIVNNDSPGDIVSY
jgi:hypothetical protein